MVGGNFATLEIEVNLMATNPVFKRPKRRHFESDSVDEVYHDLSGQDEVVKLVDFQDLVPNSHNPYPIS